MAIQMAAMKAYLRVGEWLSERGEWLKERAEGQGLGEYALILVLVAIVAFVALQVLGTTISSVLSKVSTDL